MSRSSPRTNPSAVPVAKNKHEVDVKRRFKVQSAPVSTPHMPMTDGYCYNFPLN